MFSCSCVYGVYVYYVQAMYMHEYAWWYMKGGCCHVYHAHGGGSPPIAGDQGIRETRSDTCKTASGARSRRPVINTPGKRGRAVKGVFDANRAIKYFPLTGKQLIPSKIVGYPNSE